VKTQKLLPSKKERERKREGRRRGGRKKGREKGGYTGPTPLHNHERTLPSTRERSEPSTDIRLSQLRRSWINPKKSVFFSFYHSCPTLEIWLVSQCNLTRLGCKLD
jgi:hypothetical protein